MLWNENTSVTNHFVQFWGLLRKMICAQSVTPSYTLSIFSPISPPLLAGLWLCCSLTHCPPCTGPHKVWAMLPGSGDILRLFGYFHAAMSTSVPSINFNLDLKLPVMLMACYQAGKVQFIPSVSSKSQGRRHMGNFLSVCEKGRRVGRQCFCPKDLTGALLPWLLSSFIHTAVCYTALITHLPLLSQPKTAVCCHFACDTSILSSSHQPHSSCKRPRPVVTCWFKGRHTHSETAPEDTQSASEQSRTGRLTRNDQAWTGHGGWSVAGIAQAKLRHRAAWWHLPHPFLQGQSLTGPHWESLEEGVNTFSAIPFLPTQPILAGRIPGLLTSGRWAPQAPPLPGGPKLLALRLAACLRAGSEWPKPARLPVPRNSRATAHTAGCSQPRCSRVIRERTAQDRIQMVLGHVHWGWLCNLSGQSVPVLDRLHSKDNCPVFSWNFLCIIWSARLWLGGAKQQDHRQRAKTDAKEVPPVRGTACPNAVLPGRCVAAVLCSISCVHRAHADHAATGWPVPRAAMKWGQAEETLLPPGASSEGGTRPPSLPHRQSRGRQRPRLRRRGPAAAASGRASLPGWGGGPRRSAAPSRPSRPPAWRSCGGCWLGRTMRSRDWRRRYGPARARSPSPARGRAAPEPPRAGPDPGPVARSCPAFPALPRVPRASYPRARPAHTHTPLPAACPTVAELLRQSRGQSLRRAPRDEGCGQQALPGGWVLANCSCVKLLAVLVVWGPSVSTSFPCA